jgi:hypothetical protein
LAASRVVWPILSLLLVIIAGLGMIVGHIEDWQPLEGIYFAFVTGLTVGYGDLVPKYQISRILAVGIGFTGVLLTAIFAAVSVRALQDAVSESTSPQPQTGKNTDD